MPVTSKDIANELGLSQPTVSRILSGGHGHRIAEATRQRVLEAAKRMDYRPNAVARSLRRQRTNIVGFYSAYASLDARHDFLSAIIGGLQRSCENHNLDLLLHGIQANRLPDDIYGDLTDGRIDGLFFHATLENSLVARLAASHLKVVGLVDVMPNVPSVVGDNADGMRQLIDYLWKNGHRRIGFVGPASRYESVECRTAAFRSEMESRGVSEEDAPVFKVPVEEANEAWPEIEKRKRRPTAICCWNDRAAYNLLWFCMQNGIRVPEDIAIAGFDGFVEMKLPVLQLTTVTVPYGDITERAMDIMLKLFASESVPESTVLPVVLTPGDTA
jgi:DNA-binding LacI/PurR family transcriptional regulator